MNTKPLKESLPDEHILQVEPRPRPTVDAGWRSRPHLHTGRALSAESLSTEQRERSGRLALRGQLVAPGVVAGLEVRLETRYDELEKRDVHFFQLGSGLGLTASGEDVLLPRITRVRVDQVPAFWLDEGQDPSSFDISILSNSDVAATHKGLRAAVLVLVPVVSRKDDPSDPTDPEAYSFEDQRWVDGCAPVLFAWPRGWHMPDPEALDWRNRLAWTLFEAERQRPHQTYAPWEEVGVPLALIGFTPPASIDDLATPLFADRASVVRAGGAPRTRPPLLDAYGNPLLWQARIQQFSEHLASIPPQQLTTSVRFFSRLPPVGVLPKRAVDLFEWKNHFFPAPFIIDAAPVPLEQLDAVTLASASLAPLDTSRQEHVRVLVPVPEAHFDPNLLRGEAIDPAFSETITSGLARLGEWLRRRKNLRGKATLLLNVLEGKKRNRFPEPDPSSIPGEVPGTAPLDEAQYGPEEEAYGTEGNSVPALEEALLQWGQGGTWDVPALLGIETNEVATADSRAGQFALVSRQGDATLMHTRYNETWQPWESIPKVPLGADQRLEGFRTVWSGDGLVLVALISQAIPPPAPLGTVTTTGSDRTFFLRIYHHLEATGREGVELEHVTATRVPHFATVSWAAGRLDTFMAVERTTVTDTGSVTNYQLLKCTWMHGKDEQPAVVPLPEAAGRQVSAMVSLQRPKDGRVELLFLGREPDSENNPWLHHISGFHTEGSEELSQFEMVETTDAKGNVLSVCLTGLAQLDALVMGEGKLFHGRYATDWKFDTEPVSTTAGDVLVAASRLDGRVHAFWWKRETTAASPLMYGWFDGTRWTTPVALTQVQLHNSAQPVGVILDGTSQIDLFLASTQGLQHLKMLPDSTRALVEKEGLRGLLTQTDSLLGRVDEFIRAGSTQLQADTQNVRQLMISGHTEASRLVVSPILGATMVQSPLAARSDIESYFTRFLRKRYEPEYEDPTSEQDARETMEQATATRRQLMARLVALVKELGIDVTGMTVAGVVKVYDMSTRIEAILIPNVDGTRSKAVERESILLSSLVTNTSTLNAVLERIGNELEAVDRALLNHKPLRWEKTDYFSTAVQHLEDMLVLLRELERRTIPQASAMESYKEVLAQLEAFWSQLDKRLRFVDGEVAESRQDVTVARALLAEETVRIDAINERRRQVFADHVPFLVFHRPRQRELTHDTPSRQLDAGLVENILPEVFASTAAAPPELLAYVELIRDSSLKGFTLAPQLLRGLDRTELIHRTFEWAQVRATQRVPVKMPLIAGRTSVRFAQGLSKLMSAREELIARQRGAFIRFEPAILHTQTWLELQQSAHAQLSLGDLIDMAHGRSDVGGRATTELEHISKVATGLYERFGEVLPAIRLEWAEQLSQYDAPVDLHDLSRLPQWHQLEVTRRRELQTLVDWLFQRVVATEPEAVSLMNDLVRVCLLLASHAPVNELLSGHVSKPSVARVGGTLELAVDPARVRIGMHVLIRSGEQTVQAVVEDLSSSVVKARVLSATAPSVNLPVKTSAYFSDPARGTGALLPYVGLKR